MARNIRALRLINKFVNKLVVHLVKGLVDGIVGVSLCINFVIAFADKVEVDPAYKLFPLNQNDNHKRISQHV